MNKDQLEKIINLSKKKDQRAFQKLVEHYQEFAFTLAFRLVCNEDEAKDIVQEAFIRVWKNLKKFKISTKFSTWLYKIVFNLSLDHIKVNKRRNQYLVDIEQITAISECFNDDCLETSIENNELVQIIQFLANDLTAKQRAVFVLRDLQGLEMNEISDITSLSSGTVKSNLYYARLNIREKLIKINKIKQVEHGKVR